MLAEQRSVGAYTNLPQLIRYQLPARQLSMHRNTRALKHLAGPYKSIIRGRGMEFEDVRLYQPGDDVRTIDWRVTARVGQTHTKQFREEREKPVMLIVDQRQAMFFGSRISMKSVLAADLAAYIAWASLAKGDKVGALLFNDSSQQEIRPRAQRKSVLQFLQQLNDYNQQLNYQPLSQQQYWHNILPEVRRLARPGTRLFLISDFHDLHADDDHWLYSLSRHCDITAFHIFDPLEKALPEKGIYAAFNGGQSRILDSSNRNTQQQWQQRFNEHQTQLKKQLGRFGIPLIPASTSEAPLDILQAYFGGAR